MGGCIINAATPRQIAVANVMANIIIHIGILLPSAGGSAMDSQAPAPVVSLLASDFQRMRLIRTNSERQLPYSKKAHYRLPGGVPHDEARIVMLLDHPRRREAAWGGHSDDSSKNASSATAGAARWHSRGRSAKADGRGGLTLPGSLYCYRYSPANTTRSGATVLSRGTDRSGGDHG